MLSRCAVDKKEELCARASGPMDKRGRLAAGYRTQIEKQDKGGGVCINCTPPSPPLMLLTEVIVTLFLNLHRLFLSQSCLTALA